MTGGRSIAAALDALSPLAAAPGAGAAAFFLVRFLRRPPAGRRAGVPVPQE